MKTSIRTTISILALGLAASLTSTAAMAQEPAQQGHRDAALESLRAGAVDESGLVLAAPERESLASAAAAAPILETLRAADLDLSNHELEVVLVTVAIVLIW